jgi:hypothetical protein
MPRNGTCGQCFRINPLVARPSDMHDPEKPRICNEAALDWLITQEQYRR